MFSRNVSTGCWLVIPIGPGQSERTALKAGAQYGRHSDRLRSSLCINRDSSIRISRSRPKKVDIEEICYILLRSVVRNPYTLRGSQTLSISTHPQSFLVSPSLFFISLTLSFIPYIYGSTSTDEAHRLSEQNSRDLFTIPVAYESS